MKKMINWIILIIAVISLIGNAILLNKQSITVLLENAKIINCEIDEHRKSKHKCVLITENGDIVRFEYTLPYFQDEDYSQYRDKDV